MLARKEYEKRVDELKEELLELTRAANSATEKSLQAILKWDRKMASKIEKEDDVVDEIYVRYQERCTRIIARYQPLADDLRFLEASLVVASNLERCGDYAVDIVKVMRWVETPGTIGADVLKKMADIGSEALMLSVESFIEGDMKKIDKVRALEEQSDKLYGKTFEIFESQIKKDPEKIRLALKEVLVAKSLERIADRAVNITNRTIYSVTGKREALG